MCFVRLSFYGASAHTVQFNRQVVEFIKEVPVDQADCYSIKLKYLVDKGQYWRGVNQTRSLLRVETQSRARA